MPKRNRFLKPLFLGGIFVSLYAFYNWHYRVLPQASIKLLNEVSKPTQNDTILIFSPHPDDETIATGGYIKTATLSGSKVWIVLVTDGNKHGLKDERYTEFRATTSLLGVPENQLIYLNYPDGKLTKQDLNKVGETFKNIILKVKPTIVISPDIRDRHPDHKTTGIEVNDVISELKIKPQILYYLVHYPHFPLPKELKESLYLLPPIRLIELKTEWRTFSLSGAIEDIKFQATKEYKTQLRFPPLKELLESLIRQNELFVVNKQ